MAARFDVENVVRGQYEAGRIASTPRAPGDRGIHQCERRSRGFECGNPVLSEDLLDFAPSVEIGGLAFDTGEHAQRRDPRYRSATIGDRRLDIISDADKVELPRTDFRKPDGGAELDAPVGRIGLEILKYRKPVFLCSRSRLKDIFRKSVAEESRAQLKIRKLGTGIDLAAETPFLVEVGITKLESLSSDVRTIGEQFLG